MTVILDETTTVLVQGITGREGSARTRFMKDYGTQVVAGVTPGRGGTNVWGIPVYDTIQRAWMEHGPIDVSVPFVPGPLLKDAVFEAVDAGIKTIIAPPERVPLHDIMEFVAYAKMHDVILIGPGSFGVISPGRAVAGWIGGSADFAKTIFKRGHVGVMSRSGGETTTICWHLTEQNLGVSTAVSVGGEPILGMTPAELLPFFENDTDTHGIIYFGEIGTVAEEELAEVIQNGNFTKPIVAHRSGAYAQHGMRFSHASALIEGGKGTAQIKKEALKEAGVKIVETPQQLVPTIAEILIN